MKNQKMPTLAEKQEFWAEQLPNFEATYWLPSHFEFVAFNMDQGNYVIKDDLSPDFEGDATEIWHRVNTGWAMWKKAINYSRKQAQAAPEGFVLIEASELESLKSDNEHFTKSCIDWTERAYKQRAKVDHIKNEVERFKQSGTSLDLGSFLDNLIEFSTFKHNAEFDGFVLVPEWISVKDKLPGFNQSVLCCDGFETCVAEYLESCKNDYGVFFEEGFWINGAASIFENVTHWMPLPKVIEAQEQSHE